MGREIIYIRFDEEEEDDGDEDDESIGEREVFPNSRTP